MGFGKSFYACTFVAFLLFGALHADQPASAPLNVNASNNRIFGGPDDEYFRTDVWGYPILSLRTGNSSHIVLDTKGGTIQNLGNGAILCPGEVVASLSGQSVVWARTAFEGSTAFPAIATRPFPPHISGGNPITTSIPVVFDAALAADLYKSPMYTNRFVRRSDPYNIWNRLEAVTTSDQNVRYIRSSTSPCTGAPLSNCAPSNASKAALICQGSALINSNGYPIQNTITNISIFNGTAGQSVTVNARMRLENCTGVIHTLPDDTPSGSSNFDTMYIFRIPFIVTFPSDSGDASIPVSFQDPVATGSVSGTYGPYNLNPGEWIIINISVTNDISSVLSLNVTNVTQHPSNPVNSMAVVMLMGQDTIIPAGQTKIIKANLTQGNPPYYGTLAFIIGGKSVGVACDNKTMNYSIPMNNVVIANAGSCILTPNPAFLGAGPLQINATCYNLVGGVQTQVQCPAFNWTTTAANVSLSPTSTGQALFPHVSASYSGFVAGGTITASGPAYNCSTTIACAPLTCQITANPNPIVPPQTTNLSVACRQGAANVLCPLLSWGTNLTNVSFQSLITNVSIAPSNRLFTTSTTPAQRGIVWASGLGYCSNLNCSLPNAPLIIANQTCQLPCNMSYLFPVPEPQLAIGQQLWHSVTCYSRDPVTGALTSIPCPVGWWTSNAGSMSPNVSSISTPVSALNVSNIFGTYVMFNYTDFAGVPCNCSHNLRPALPDYIAHGRTSPGSYVGIGSTVQIYASVENIGAANATNISQALVTMPGGSATYTFQVLPLRVSETSSPEAGPYSFVCSIPGIISYTVHADYLGDVAESNESNNIFTGNVNCGNVLVCADYI